MPTILSIVSYPFLPARSGGEKGVALFNKYFSLNCNLVCVTTRRNDPAAATGYEVKNILSDGKWRYVNIFYFYTLRKIIRERSVSHVMLEHPYYGWLGFLLKSFCGVKLIVHSHNIEGLRWKTLGKWWWKLLWQYERFTHRRADYNFFIHDHDREYAIKEFGLDRARCMTVTYGIETDVPPHREERLRAKMEICASNAIDPQKKILLFNGAFRYKPNIDALDRLIHTVNPILQQKIAGTYVLLICGIGIPERMLRVNAPDVKIIGFVDDVGLYFKGADVFLNPVNEGGGIKTKLVEALGANLNAVSTQNGATGIEPQWCNGKLFTVANDDWAGFGRLVSDAILYEADTPPIFFDHFYWGNTARRAASFIQTGST